MKQNNKQTLKGSFLVSFLVSLVLREGFKGSLAHEHKIIELIWDETKY